MSVALGDFPSAGPAFRTEYLRPEGSGLSSVSAGVLGGPGRDVGAVSVWAGSVAVRIARARNDENARTEVLLEAPMTTKRDYPTKDSAAVSPAPPRSSGARPRK